MRSRPPIRDASRLPQARGDFLGWEARQVSAPLPRIREECLLWEVDADEALDCRANRFCPSAFPRSSRSDEPLLVPLHSGAARCHCDPLQLRCQSRHRLAPNVAYRPGDRWGRARAANTPSVRGDSFVARSTRANRTHFSRENEDAGAVFQPSHINGGAGSLQADAIAVEIERWREAPRACCFALGVSLSASGATSLGSGTTRS